MAEDRAPAPFHANVEDMSAYRAALAAAEAAAAPFVDPGETPAEGEPTATVEETEAATQVEPQEPEPSQQTATPAEEQTPDERYAELQRQIAERDARIAEQQAMIGRQSTEVGEWRQKMAELEARLDTASQQAPAVPTMPVTQDLIDTDPARATQLAFIQRDEAALQRAYEAWADEEPATAAVWLAEQKTAVALAEMEARHQQQLEELRASTQPSVEQSQAAQEQAILNQAFELAKVDRPDFLEHADRIFAEVIPAYPNISRQLLEGSVEQKAEVLKVLYDIDKMNRQSPEAVKAQLEAEAAAAAAEEASSTASAAVVTGQTTASAQEGERELTYEERERLAYANRQASRTSWEKQMAPFRERMAGR